MNFDPSDLIIYKENGIIQSAGYKINSLLMNRTLFSGGGKPSETDSHILNHLVIPIDLGTNEIGDLFDDDIDNNTTIIEDENTEKITVNHIDIQHHQQQTCPVIEDDLYDKLFKLSHIHQAISSKSNHKTPRTKKTGKKTQSNKNKK